MLKTVDGFPIQGVDFSPDKADPAINKWSWGKTVKVGVADFYFNPRVVEWRGKTMRVVDYELWYMLIDGLIKGSKWRLGMTEEEALDLAFDI